MGDTIRDFDTEKDDDTRRELLNLIDVESLKSILNAFTTTTGLMANIVDVNGRSIFSKKDVRKCCKFCKLIISMKNGQERCQSAYKRAGKQAALFGEPYIFRCPSGLIEWAAPIIVDGKHLGSIICGQVLMWEPEEFFWIELREMNKSLTSDFKELFKAVEELPIVSGDMVQAASYLLYIIANFITKSGWEQKQSNAELLKQKLRLNEELENRKKLEEQLGQMFIYSMNKESDLMEAIKYGKLDRAQTHEDPFLRTKAAAAKTVELLQKAIEDGKVACADRDAAWLDMMADAIDEIPDDKAEFYAEMKEELEDGAFLPKEYNLE